MDNKDAVLNTINETTDKIKIFKKELMDKENNLPDIKAIASSLNGIEKVIKDIKKLCDNETKALELIIQNLKYAQIVELLDKKDVMFDTINENLPNGMKLTPDNNSPDQNMEILFDDSVIGGVRILEELVDGLYVEVKINDAVDRFEVVKPKRMYHIISFINTKFNYE